MEGCRALLLVEQRRMLLSSLNFLIHCFPFFFSIGLILCLPKRLFGNLNVEINGNTQLACDEQDLGTRRVASL